MLAFLRRKVLELLLLKIGLVKLVLQGCPGRRVVLRLDRNHVVIDNVTFIRCIIRLPVLPLVTTVVV